MGLGSGACVCAWRLCLKGLVALTLGEVQHPIVDPLHRVGDAACAWR